MAVTWYKTKFLGVRYREHNTRKHGLRLDRCFSIRYKVDGKDKEEVAGWSSEGMDSEKAFKVLSAIRDNIRTGVGARSLAEMRQEREQHVEELAREQRRKEKESLTVNDFWESTYLPALETSKSAWTIKTEKHLYANWVRPALGDISLRKLDAKKVEALALKSQTAGKSAATTRHILALVSQIWNKAALHDLVQGESPVRRIKKPRQDNRRMRFLTPDEARSLLDILVGFSQDCHDTALLSLFCGLRAGEIHALTWGDIDMERGVIHIRDPKNKHNRHAFITEEARAMLTRRYESQSKTNLIFPATNGKVRIWISDSFNRAVDKLGLNDTGDFTTDAEGNNVPVKITDARQRVVFHTLRHTFASWLVQGGTPLYTVAELMGHTSLEMTRRYSHLAPDSLRKAAMSLEGQLDKKTRVIEFKHAQA